MFVLAWEEKYKSGIKLLDVQHEELFMILNVYNMKCECKRNIDETISLLKRLTQYVLSHFQAEEAYMVTSAYPKMREHQAMHKTLEFEVKKYLTLLSDSSYPPTPLLDEVGSLISNWLIEHIAKSDMDFFQFYGKKIL